MQHQKVMVNSHNNNKKMMMRKSKSNKILVRVNVVGSTGPIKVVVNKDDSVATVVNSALRAYAKQGRLLPNSPLSSNNTHFLLYSSKYDGFTDYSQALSPGEAIGSSGSRNFVMCKKQAPTTTSGVNNMSQKLSLISSLKAWLNRNFH